MYSHCHGYVRFEARLFSAWSVGHIFSHQEEIWLGGLPVPGSHWTNAPKPVCKFGHGWQGRVIQIQVMMTAGAPDERETAGDGGGRRGMWNMQAQSQVRGGCEEKGRAWRKGGEAMRQGNGRFGWEARGRGVCVGRLFAE